MVVLHQGACCQSGPSSGCLLLGWCFIRVPVVSVVLHQGSLLGWSVVRVVLHQGACCQGCPSSIYLLSGWSFIRVPVVRVVLHQGACCQGGASLGYLSSAWSFIRVVCCQGGPSSECLLSGWSFIKVPFVRVVLHQGSLWSGWSFVRVLFYQGSMCCVLCVLQRRRKKMWLPVGQQRRMTKVWAGTSSMVCSTTLPDSIFQREIFFIFILVQVL